MSRLLVSTAVACAACVAVPSASPAQLVERFEVTNAVFSPDLDGVEETTNVTFTLSTSAPVVWVVVFEADSVTPVDTLLSPQSRPSGRTNLTWDGFAWNGAAAPDGAFLVTLSASGATEPDTTAHRAVFVDTGVPSIHVDLVTPNPYAPLAPGQPSDLTIDFTVAGATPPLAGIPRDELQRVFRTPTGSAFTPDSLLYAPPFVGGDGSYALVWRAQKITGLAGGENEVTLTIVDQAGHSSSSTHTFVLDVKAPDVKITSPTTGLSFRQAPDTLAGWAWDALGLGPVEIRYRDSGPYEPVTPVSVVDDTLFFSALLSDSLGAEGEYEISFRATDVFGRVATTTLDVRIDLTAQQAPTLDPFTGVWHTDAFRLTGSFDDDGGSSSRLRFYRNGVVVDSVLTLPIDEIDHVVPLVPGENVLVVTFVDVALNESAPSNAVVVTFDVAVGLFIDAPFAPHGEFQLSLARAASGVALRVYDMTGDLVARIDRSGEDTHYAIAWDGRNGSGELVAKGPLVAVASVSFADGGTSVFRELFLFEPQPE